MNKIVGIQYQNYWIYLGFKIGLIFVNILSNCSNSVFAIGTNVRVPKGRDMVKKTIYNLQYKYGAKLGKKQVWLVLSLSQASSIEDQFIQE